VSSATACEWRDHAEPFRRRRRTASPQPRRRTAATITAGSRRYRIAALSRHSRFIMVTDRHGCPVVCPQAPSIARQRVKEYRDPFLYQTQKVDAVVSPRDPFSAGGRGRCCQRQARCRRTGMVLKRGMPRQKVMSSPARFRRLPEGDASPARPEVSAPSVPRRRQNRNESRQHTPRAAGSACCR